jgi:hypothetical protein
MRNRLKIRMIGEPRFVERSAGSKRIVTTADSTSGRLFWPSLPGRNRSLQFEEIDAHPDGFRHRGEMVSRHSYRVNIERLLLTRM